MELKVTKLKPKLDSTNRVVPDAFHGTSKARASAIESEGFKASVGDDQYLGDGVYFFESSRSCAGEWAKDHFGPSDSAVFHCELKLGRCIDLTDAEHIDFVARVADLVRSSALKRQGARKNVKITDALVINFVCQYGKFDSVRAAYVRMKGGKVFEGSHFYFHSRLFLCVRNLENILRTTRIL